jgi:Sensors of blue-light using FAD
MRLRAIVYFSSAVHRLTNSELEHLLMQSRHANALAEITGVLLVHERRFIQCIEGPPLAVSRTFERIRASRLHRHIITVLDRPIAFRDFAEWSMGLARPSTSDFLALWSARWQAVLESGSIAPAEGDGMALLKAFWSLTGGGANPF